MIMCATITFHLLGWHAERRTWFQLVYVLLLPGVPWRSHSWFFFLIPLYPVPLPLFFPPDPLLLTLPLSFSLPLSLSPLPLTVISLPFSFPVPLSRIPFTFTLLLTRKRSVFTVFSRTLLITEDCSWKKMTNVILVELNISSKGRYQFQLTFIVIHDFATDWFIMTACESHLVMVMGLLHAGTWINIQWW